MYNGDGLNFTILSILAVIGLAASLYGLYSLISFLVSHLSWVS